MTETRPIATPGRNDTEYDMPNVDDDDQDMNGN